MLFPIMHQILYTYYVLLISRLFRGQSGDALLVLDTTKDELYIVGILHGQFMAPHDWCEGTLYQATVVAPALKYLENIMFTNQITGHLRLITSDLAEHGMDVNNGIKVEDVVGDLYCRG